MIYVLIGMVVTIAIFIIMRGELADVITEQIDRCDDMDDCRLVACGVAIGTFALVLMWPAVIIFNVWAWFFYKPESDNK